MTSDSKKLIVGLVARHLDIATRDHIDSEIRLAATKASHAVWDQHNPQDGVGGPSMNPYNVSIAIEQLVKTDEALRVAREAHDLVVKTFLTD